MPSPSLVSLALNGESYLVRVITVYDIVPSPFIVHVWKVTLCVSYTGMIYCPSSPISLCIRVINCVCAVKCPILLHLFVYVYL